MKFTKVIFRFSLFMLFSNSLSGQGLEDIIVEKFYITVPEDTIYKGTAAVKLNSVTYRIYVDLKPGYALQSVYGAPGHEMILKTSSSFFNHPVHGHYIGNLVMDRLLGVTTMMLDSWISVGAASQQRYGVLKADDDSLETVVNGYEPTILQGDSKEAGIPINHRDGLLRRNKPPRVTQLGLDSLLENLSQKTTETGYKFTTTNGAWACVGGAKGPVPETNRIIIGQFTTDGDFYFEFNLQIGDESGNVEQYVAKNPSGKEKLFRGLIISETQFSN